jgi:GNAT superfamily N-acetyltransferase
MDDKNPGFLLSEIDRARFGVRTAKAFISKTADIYEIMKSCESHRVEFLIARCPTRELEAVHEMERLGFSLTDTLLFFSHDLKRIPEPDALQGVTIRRAEQGEGHAVRGVAGESFRGYLSHYHADGRLEREKCDEAYEDWAFRACTSSAFAEDVFVAESDDRVIGFGTMRVNDEKDGEGGLFAVAPSYQGRGVYRSIMIRCLDWCAEKGLRKMIISTQVTNLTSQKVWIRLGFEPSHSHYTFHKWFEPVVEGSSRNHENL